MLALQRELAVNGMALSAKGPQRRRYSELSMNICILRQGSKDDNATEHED
jgi:hypothetical protein